ncbi:hypothetical protein FS749_004703 [Ceratobasidium sp. UAMH 11750]|nr:hypothetical protein FS749_004703 [Ceratobasidium sp. UAMH 11750]
MNRVRLFARLSRQLRVFRPSFIRQYLIRFCRRFSHLQLSALARQPMRDSTSVPCSGSLRPSTGLLQLEVDSSTSPMSWFVRLIAVKADPPLVGRLIAVIHLDGRLNLDANELRTNLVPISYLIPTCAPLVAVVAHA